MKIALLQTPVGMDKAENLRHAREQVRIAAQ
jgi:predicted amidohydrolase